MQKKQKPYSYQIFFVLLSTLLVSQTSIAEQKVVFEKLDKPRMTVLNDIENEPEETVDLSAVSSTDPDGDRISFRWFQYQEAGTLPAKSARINIIWSIKWSAQTINTICTL